MIEALAAAIVIGTAPVELASPDDCAIIVAIGKGRLDWGASPPKYAFFPDWPQGAGVYRESCPWRSLGVAEPVIGTPASPNGFYVGRPAYDAGRTHATATLALSVRPSFLETFDCELEKRDGAWRLIACRTLAIT